jgi:hypothetical protein
MDFGSPHNTPLASQDNANTEEIQTRTYFLAPAWDRTNDRSVRAVENSTHFTCLNFPMFLLSYVGRDVVVSRSPEQGVLSISANNIPQSGKLGALGPFLSIVPHKNKKNTLNMSG